ncbi:hypothetical protein J7T55_014964 [Diaporthe amygdali]|uniref:uncharacterized protein n=1 Tax=Phomopsis amygdali TaxID=1214568 RepID=UPI0022FE92B3|nr:uncharacterized protein J7T55_014964 [Diaporthe amygdali]KAJ0106888.1 hypothetical protein J7T55_014964 [Diaporthe amygdali]
MDPSTSNMSSYDPSLFPALNPPAVLGDPLGPHQWNVPLTAITHKYVVCIPVDQELPGLDPTKWEERAGNNRCGRRSIDVSAAQGLFGAVTDLYVLTIPISSVLALHLPKKRKIGVLGIFLTGLLAIVLFGLG